MNIRSFLKGKLQIVAFAIFVCAALTSCADDSVTTAAKGESGKTEYVGLPKSTIQVSLGGGVQLDPATRSLDSDGAETRSVLIKRNGTKYTPIVEGDQMEARIFIAQGTKKKVVDGKEVFEPVYDVVGAGKVTFQAKQLPDGSISLYYPENTIDFSWVSNSVVPKPGEKWYICGIIGGEYKQEYDADRRNKKLSEYKRYLADLKYNFYVDCDPNSSPKHNQMDENGNVQVVAPYTTGWVQLDSIERAGVINQRALKFKPIGTLLHFRVKRDSRLVPAEACRYAFASSQISANGGFLMMRQSKFHQGDELQQDYKMGVDCEVRPSINSIENNFCWDHKGDRQFHMNNTDITTEENDATWGDRIYEYRYTFDASSGKNLRDGYDDFYVWGMPITYKDSNGQPVIGQTMLTAERGGYMLGRKQPDGAKYTYADEWLYASGTPKLASGEYRVLDFRAENKKNKAYSVEVGVCRPRYSEMENNQPKYPWANPLERVAVTNSKADEKGFHTDNESHATTSGWGWIYNYSLKSRDFKMRFVYGDKPLLPDGYHVPTNAEFGAIFPNNITSYSARSLPIDYVMYESIQKGSVPYWELYDPGDDDTRSIIVAGEDINTNKEALHEGKPWENAPLFYAYYMVNPGNKQEFYAIRFMGNNKDAVSADKQKKFGNRYRCVYRWRTLDLGGDIADASDAKGARVVVQSRWIGNANVSLRDITNEQWWGKCAPDNPLYNVDCYRVLPSTGYPKALSGYDLSYYSRTYWKYTQGEHYDKHPNDYNITFCYRTYTKDGYSRGHNDNNKAHYGIRLICQRTQDEFGPNAPRQNQRDDSQLKLINRPADARVGKWEYIPPKK